jgi:tetratricopeptide (TPR) repeat protein
MDPDNLAVRNKLALALYRNNQLKEAKEELTYILEKDSANFDALDSMGIVLLRMGKYKEALEYLKKAVKVNKDDVMVHVHLSVVYEKLKSASKARSELDKARSLTSGPAELENVEKELRMVRGG